ncbi:MAG: putative rane copper tolerance protein [Myxococcaceae bacterium]|nr:putative rane copper tolerance protein [Myxococcaceae bacterium]
MPSFLPLAVLTGSSLALVSSAHCAVMCGPIALASRVRYGSYAGLSYFGGRLVSYTLAGALAGSAGRVLLLSPWARATEAVLSWALAGLLLYTALALLRGARKTRLLQLRKRPRVSATGRMLALVADDPLLLGAATALLPCAALFSALVAAARLGDAAQGAAAMGTFASITGLVVVGVGQLARLRVHAPIFRRMVAAALLIGAFITVYRTLPLFGSDGEVPACHAVVAASAPRAGEARR